MKPQTIAQGAEAIIRLDENKIIKDRITKGYRHQQLDQKIRKSRTKRETKLLIKAKKIINAPQVFNQDKFSIEIEYINGDRLSETLNKYPEQKQFQIMQQIGEQTAKLHKQDIIHGDLTTSNTILATNNKINSKNHATITNARSALSAARRDPMISEPKARLNEQSSTQPKVFFIDFGLGFISARIEDKAVDIHLIKQALEAKHWQNHEQLFQEFLKGYNWEEKEKVLEQLKKVEARGRYKY